MVSDYLAYVDIICIGKAKSQWDMGFITPNPVHL